jgi:Methyltransferase domain
MSLGAENTLEAVRVVYSGAEGELWELLMGQQIHIGGFKASADLAERAQIGAGQQGVDLCCCNGGGMRFLVRFRGVAAMTGVDATEAVIERGKERCRAEGVSEQVHFVHGDACATGLPDGAADFVWGEDAWCYVFDKARLISEQGAQHRCRRGQRVLPRQGAEVPAQISRGEHRCFPLRRDGTDPRMTAVQPHDAGIRIGDAFSLSRPLGP